MTWGGTGDVKYNNRYYHALADECYVFSKSYNKNAFEIFRRASRHLGKKFIDLDLRTCIEIDKQFNSTTYRKRVQQMFADVLECERICSLVVAARKENQSLYKDNDPGHERAVQLWIIEEAVWKMRREDLEPLAFIYTQ